MTDQELLMKRKCSYLLPDPGGEVVRELLDEIDKLRTRLHDLETGGGIPEAVQENAALRENSRAIQQRLAKIKRYTAEETRAMGVAFRKLPHRFTLEAAIAAGAQHGIDEESVRTFLDLSHWFHKMRNPPEYVHRV